MESKSLKTLVAETSALEQMLIESGGEITPDIEAALTVKELQLPEKVDNYSFVIDRMDSISSWYKAKADMFLRLSKSADNVAERCKTNMKFAMQELNVTEIVGNDIRFKLVKTNPAVNIPDESKIDASYKITETITKIDKKRISEDLKLGVIVAGAELMQGQSLRVYANSEGRKK